MRIIVVSLLLAMISSPALARLTCWYNEFGVYTGADTPPSWTAGVANGVATQQQPNGSYAWFININENRAQHCPQSLATGVGQNATAGAGPDYRLEPAYGSVHLAAGFQPDPFTVELEAGGIIDAAATLGGDCVGYIAEAPDYRINYTAGAYPLVIWTDSAVDTTLVINTPSEDWVCADDISGDNLNARVMWDSPASGQYDIWVGAFQQGQVSAAALHISELADGGPDREAAPISAVLDLQSYEIPISRQDPSYTQMRMDIVPAIYLTVVLDDGTTVEYDYGKDFADNVVFDDVTGDPRDLIEVVYWDVDSQRPDLGVFGAQLTSTGNGVGPATLLVTFVNAPGVTASIQARVVSTQ